MVSGDILFFLEFIKTELIPKRYNYLGMQGELEMTKEQLLKQAAIEWLLKSGNENVEELLKSATSNAYKEE
ncbi:hypothetical protein B1R38_20640 [Bacillus cereus]|nr:hypothetical protein B1R38_20640 [Bacillus cereus]